MKKRLVTSLVALLVILTSIGCTMNPKYEIQNQEYYNKLYEEGIESLESGMNTPISELAYLTKSLDKFNEMYYSGYFDEEEELLSETQDMIFAQINSILDVLNDIIKELSNEEKERTLKEMETVVGEDLTNIIDEVFTKQVELLKVCTKELNIIKNKYDGEPLDKKYYSNMEHEIESYEIYQEEIIEHAANMAIGTLFGSMLNGGLNKMMEEAFSVFY